MSGEISTIANLLKKVKDCCDVLKEGSKKRNTGFLVLLPAIRIIHIISGVMRNQVRYSPRAESFTENISPLVFGKISDSSITLLTYYPLDCAKQPRTIKVFFSRFEKVYKNKKLYCLIFLACINYYDYPRIFCTA